MVSCATHGTRRRDNLCTSFLLSRVGGNLQYKPPLSRFANQTLPAPSRATAYPPCGSRSAPNAQTRRATTCDGEALSRKVRKQASPGVLFFYFTAYKRNVCQTSTNNRCNHKSQVLQPACLFLPLNSYKLQASVASLDAPARSCQTLSPG